MAYETWKELWLKNYRGEGDTADLDKFLKKLNYGSRMDISYLPWAVVDRIFKLQDGEVEILRHEDGSIVEVDRTHIKDEAEEGGVFIPRYMNSYFINIVARWQGRTHTERYPLQDSNGRPLSVWTQNELHKVTQRGRVKAIAAVSGIGYKLFEDGDLQFEDDATKGEPKAATSKSAAGEAEPKPTAKAPVNKFPAAPKLTPPAEDAKPKAEEDAKPKVEEVKKEVPVNTEEIPDVSKLPRVEIENAVKSIFLTGGNAKVLIVRDYLSAHNTTKLTSLKDEELKELHALLLKE